MDKSSDHFNELAKTWDTEETIQRTLVFAQAIKKHLGESKVHHLLDFGCGTGLLAEHFLKKSQFITGIDTSFGMIEKFNLRFQNHSEVNAFITNLEESPMPEQNVFYDVIISSMAFHHLNDPKKTLKLLKNQLTPEGMIFIIDLDEEDGTFHPDNKGMGVKHFGFSHEAFQSWSADLGFKTFRDEIIFTIQKNQRSYGVRLGVFSL